MGPSGPYNILVDTQHLKDLEGSKNKTPTGFGPPFSIRPSSFCLGLLHVRSTVVTLQRAFTTAAAAEVLRPDQMISPDFRSTSVRCALSALMRSISTCRPVYAAANAYLLQRQAHTSS